MIPLVDDTAEVLELSAALVAYFGYNYVCACNGFEALILIETDPSVDILFTDLQMPGMHGFELAQRAKTIRTDLKVLDVTGHPSPIPDQPRETLGPILRKPFGWRQLAEYLCLASA